MDRRTTFKDDEELITFLSALQEENKKVSLLVDDEGIGRMEGRIVSIAKNKDIPNSSFTLDDNTQLLIKQVIAVNGNFRSDYSEC